MNEQLTDIQIMFIAMVPFALVLVIAEYHLQATRRHNRKVWGSMREAVKGYRLARMLGFVGIVFSVLAFAANLFLYGGR